jgi:hypothetical protein
MGVHVIVVEVVVSQLEMSRFTITVDIIDDALTLVLLKKRRQLQSLLFVQCS